MSEYIHNSHKVTVLMYHLVFPAKYKRVVFDEEVDEVLKEVLLGHLKADHRMNWRHLKGADGDSLHAVLFAAGYNIRWLLRMIIKKRLSLFCGCCRPRV
jgi:hypothetical protein